MSWDHCCGVNYNYLVVFVGGVVLEKDDALTVQTPVVPLSLLGVGVGWDEFRQQRQDIEEWDRERSECEGWAIGHW